MSEIDPAGSATTDSRSASIEAPEADAAEQAAELDDRDAGPPEPVPSTIEANEADLAEQGLTVTYDEDDYR